MSPKVLDWAAIRDFYEVGHTKDECQLRFGFSDWDWHSAVGRDDVRPRTRGAPVLSSQRRALIARLRGEGLSYNAIRDRLGIAKSTVAYHARRLGVRADDRAAQRYNWRDVQEAIDGGASRRECMARFGFCAASWTQAIRRGEVVPPARLIPLEELLVVGRRTSRSHLKRRLIAAGLKENRCEDCGITHWRGKPLAIELHHRNGRKNDNRIENLAFLCGNCHTQTHSWGGKNARRENGDVDAALARQVDAGDLKAA